MKKLKTLRVEEDLLQRLEVIEPNFNKAVVELIEGFVDRNGPVGEMADAPPARKQRTVAPRATPSSDGSPKESAGSNPVPDPKRIATSAVTAIGETVTPAADLRYARPTHDLRTCKNPYCLVCKKNDA